ncbi:MAG: mannan endo-1,4-beta-mannosidase [Algoriphagus sp.]|jgi:mannan endo-1,4-beta-mannosidase
MSELNSRIFFNQTVMVTGFFAFLSLSLAAQVDSRATTETTNLLNNLKSVKTLFGHQDDPVYGLNPDKTRWIDEAGRSDIKSIIGEYPALIGYDIGHLELGKSVNLDNVPFDKMRLYIIDQYKRGGVSTLSWHPNNPLDLSKTTWDKVEATIPSILRNRKALKNYKMTFLKPLASFFKSLKSSNGEDIPIIFRPYHEHTGSWFWWGADYCSEEEYKAFWKMTVDYFKKKRVHNLLYAYSTDKFRSEEHYLERYPGDDYVDILGFDTYHRNAPSSNGTFVKNSKEMLGIVKKIGLEKDKPYALSETGLEQVTEANWWTTIFLPVLEGSGASYIMVWRNGRPDHFYAPYPGHSSESDFKKMAESGEVLFEKGAKAEGLYK